jgi:hypothetical protein
MGLKKRVMSHVVEPAALRLLQWRGDPVARLMLPATKADPYPLYAQVRQRGLVRSPLGVFAAADGWGHEVRDHREPDRERRGRPAGRPGRLGPAPRRSGAGTRGD